jgi:Amt family ammonium transporter
MGTALLACGSAAWAEEVAAPPGEAPPTIIANGLSAADTAWMLVCSALVLMMTAPGLALFYGGLVRKKNILGVMMQCIFLMGMMSVVWALWGYSLAFGPDIAGGFVGGGDYVMLRDVIPEWVGPEGKEIAKFVDGKPVVENKLPVMETVKNVSYVPMEGVIPRSVHMVFQMMFFIITPGLICGAFAERMKFSAMVLFSLLWGTLIYCPVAHWVWSAKGIFNSLNADARFPAFDFAGGTVVHISSGISALICCLLLGKRLGFNQEPMPPHNLTYTFIGAGLLWVGWFGFNAGSALLADTYAANAFVATHLAAAAGTIAWSIAEWVTRKKPSILGACSGAVAGLVCITPASGIVTPLAGIILGFAAGFVCFFACTTIKSKFKYDDSLDAFGVHGVGGTLGAILTGVFATRAINGNPKGQGLLEGNTTQFLNQIVAVAATAALAVIGTVILLKIIDATIGLRVTQDDEITGLDVSQHGEEGYIFH